MSIFPILLALCFPAAADEPIRLDAHKQLFLDDCMVASAARVERRIHPVRKHEGNPVLWPQEPWEGKAALVYGSILREGDKYRMWYHSDLGVNYAESNDGITWDRPQLDLVQIDGHKTNLLIRRKAGEREPGHIPFFYELFGVTRDDREPNPSNRYKLGFLSINPDYAGPDEDPLHQGSRRALGVAGSPDGIHWKVLNNWATHATCDGGTYWMLDPSRNKYVLYGRTKYIAPGLLEAWTIDDWLKRQFWGRSVARVESPDLLNWDIREPAKAPVVMTADTRDKPGTEIYSMSVFAYETVYIGLVQIFYNRPDACHLDIQLAVSRDGVHFERVGDRTPFIPVGDIGSWDRFNNAVANNPPISVGDELRFYYSGRTYRHSPYTGPDKGESAGGIGFGTIKKDRFVSLCASFDRGRIRTKPLTIGGSTLHLNAKSDFGAILVRAFDSSGKLLAQSKPIRQDSLDIEAQWEQGALERSDEPVVLEFELANAHLFAVWCTDH